MINKFEKQLEKWNDGVLRGAQAKLARLLRVSTATVALWTTGKRRPSKGYAVQMAQLFGLDAYDVMRLFSPTTTYPELQSNKPACALRDAQLPENTYSADNMLNERDDQAGPLSNSVSLPCLTNHPENYPHNKESDIAEWWSVPRRYAKGAKYLFCDEQSPNKELYFICPEPHFLEGQFMLIKTPTGYTVKRVRKESGKIALYTESHTLFGLFPPTDLLAIGTAVQKISAV